MNHKIKLISIFTLVMINVAAIGSVKNWPFTAEYGLASVFYLVLASLVFFFPVSLIAAELATKIPEKGGVYIWVKKAFGDKWGFLAIWLLWIENVVWYPTILSFTSATLAYIFNPTLAENKIYTTIVILSLFWLSTLSNLFGMRTSGWMSNLGALCGTFLPGFLIIGLGMVWFFSGQPLQISFEWKELIPNLSSLDQMVFFIGVLFSLAGMEMSAVHLKEVKHPERNFPRAIFLSVFIILILSILGVLSIASVVPQKEISLVAGALQAISIFLEKDNLSHLTPLFAALISIGAIGSVSTWIIGPTKGLLAVAEKGDLPAIFQKKNAKGVPTFILLCQGIIVTILSLLFLFVPTVSSGFWMLTVLVAQLYLLMYILFFAAAIKLRYTHAETQKGFSIPCGRLGMWVVAGLGILSSLFALIIGFFPPAQIETGNRFFYVSFLIAGILIGCIIPFIFIWHKKYASRKAL